MKIIRLWGVIAFFILGLLLALGWYLLAPYIIANGIEKAGAEALGAKVEVNQVELGLFPLQIEIKGLQATDPDQPMKNLFEVSNITFALDSKSLLWKKVLINKMNIEGIQLGTSRKSSGELEGGRATEKLANKVSSIELPAMTEGDIKELVEKADLITVKRLNELNKSQQELQDYWKSALDKQSYQQRIEELKKEFNRLSARAKKNKMNLIGDRKKWKKLKKNIDKERKGLAELNKKLKQDKNLLKKQIADVRQGPKDDLNAIMGKMGLGNGVAGLSDKFLGPEFTPWIKKALAMTKSMGGESGSAEETPVYSSSKGKRVLFKDEQLFPDVLIRKIKLSGKDEHWVLSGLGNNIGYLPWKIHQPISLKINLTGEGQANFSTKTQWPSVDKMSTDVSAKVTNWPISNMKLMQTDQGNWLINSGQLDSVLKGKVTLEEVDIKLFIKLNNPNITVPESLSGWQKTLAESLNQQKQLSIDVTAAGSLTNPSIKVKSNIEKLFSSAIGAKVKQQAEKYKGKLTKAISEKVGDLSSLENIIGDLDQWSEQLKGNDDLLKKLKGGI